MPIQDITQATLVELQANATEFFTEPGHTQAHKVWRANAASSAVAAIASANAAKSLETVQAVTGQFAVELGELRAENTVLANELVTLQASVTENQQQAADAIATLNDLVASTTTSVQRLELQVGRLRASGNALGLAMHAGLRQLDSTLAKRLDGPGALALRVANVIEILLVEAPQILEHRLQGPYTLEQAVEEINQRLVPFAGLHRDVLDFLRPAPSQDAHPGLDVDFARRFDVPVHDEAVLSRELAHRAEIATRLFVVVALWASPAGTDVPPSAAPATTRARRAGTSTRNEQP